MQNVYVRIVFYLLCGAAIGLTAAGLATFDFETGVFDLHPVNLYTVAGLVGPALAAFGAFFKWGTK